ncbi:MAG: Asp-tRNA(Asn)/Glu-tRNA(Gln) amidotransferase subunit GatC [Defluviitaleaceae bacterium]|nr:Asp-tRNA(Asn)/Glu-tRNA(Gln) amidotransferase subunit GatC [Defluviitaleaceae bacterium]MCL2238946.1 Asp-tRNA(Asn)/Glu-tRNA(Gln) amidotransferase subunit GatC [Defluviitaleaceae bacterium]
MQIDNDLVTYLETLSNLTFTGEEREIVKGDLGNILNAMTHMGQIETQRVQELSHPVGHVNVFREDEPGLPFDRERILQNAPRRNSEMFIAPGTVGS